MNGLATDLGESGRGGVMGVALMSGLMHLDDRGRNVVLVAPSRL